MQSAVSASRAPGEYGFISIPFRNQCHHAVVNPKDALCPRRPTHTTRSDSLLYCTSCRSCLRVERIRDRLAAIHGGAQRGRLVVRGRVDGGPDSRASFGTPGLCERRGRAGPLAQDRLSGRLQRGRPPDGPAGAIRVRRGSGRCKGEVGEGLETRCEWSGLAHLQADSSALGGLVARLIEPSLVHRYLPEHLQGLGDLDRAADAAQQWQRLFGKRPRPRVISRRNQGSRGAREHVRDIPGIPQLTRIRERLFEERERGFRVLLAVAEAAKIEQAACDPAQFPELSIDAQASREVIVRGIVVAELRIERPEAVESHRDSLRIADLRLKLQASLEMHPRLIEVPLFNRRDPETARGGRRAPLVTGLFRKLDGPGKAGLGRLEVCLFDCQTPEGKYGLFHDIRRWIGLLRRQGPLQVVAALTQVAAEVVEVP